MSHTPGRYTVTLSWLTCVPVHSLHCPVLLKYHRAFLPLTPLSIALQPEAASAPACCYVLLCSSAKLLIAQIFYCSNSIKSYLDRNSSALSSCRGWIHLHLMVQVTLITLTCHSSSAADVGVFHSSQMSLFRQIDFFCLFLQLDMMVSIDKWMVFSVSFAWYVSVGISTRKNPVRRKRPFTSKEVQDSIHVSTLLQHR